MMQDLFDADPGIRRGSSGGSRPPAGAVLVLLACVICMPYFAPQHRTAMQPPARLASLPHNSSWHA